MAGILPYCLHFDNIKIVDRTALGLGKVSARTRQRQNDKMSKCQISLWAWDRKLIERVRNRKKNDGCAEILGYQSGS